MTDCHAHLDACSGGPGPALARARAVGVRRVVSIGTTIASCRETLALAEQEEGVYAALGLHPHEAAPARLEEIPTLRGLLAHPRAVAVGETGLDHYRDYATPQAQLSLFAAQAALAAEVGKALVVHTRAADDATVAVLRELPGDVPVVLHCFSSPRLLAPALEHGWYVSFAGNVTYPKAAELRTAAASVPTDRLLAETDSPYLAPQPVRGRENEPAHVVHTLAVLARARGIEPDELERTVDENAARAFGLP